MIGYYRKPEATAAPWLTDGCTPATSATWTMTASELERVIAQHPAMHEAGVIGVPDDQWGKSDMPSSCCTLAAN